MADHRNADAQTKTAGDDQRLRVVTRPVVVPHVSKTEPQLDQDVRAKLLDATVNPNPSLCKTAIDDALAGGLSAEDIADYYIPQIARDLGDQWCVDKLSFAAVTIGSSRLQSMLRLLGSNWSGNCSATHFTRAVLLVVPKEIYHTLGAIVLGGQLRRMGVSVKLVLGGHPKEVAERISRTSYQAVFISSSMGETLVSLRKIVDAVRASTKTPPPIVIGGTILDVETVENVMALTGADYATRIPEEALELCGLLENKNTARGA